MFKITVWATLWAIFSQTHLVTLVEDWKPKEIGKGGTVKDKQTWSNEQCEFFCRYILRYSVEV
jgi:hypothetical protein